MPFLRDLGVLVVKKRQLVYALSLPNSITKLFHIEQSYCYPDWLTIGDLIDEELPKKEWPAAWNEACRFWLEQICEHGPEKLSLHETDNFMLLSTDEPKAVKRLGKNFEKLRGQILNYLPKIAVDEGFGKLVVMMFSHQHHYYEYISHFHEDGEHPQSGGMFITGGGYSHIVFPPTDEWLMRTVFVHELTHNFLMHLPIPPWMNEALAMYMEEKVCGSEIFHIDQDIYQKHIDHWNAETIQEFWSGQSWRSAGEDFNLCYNLAQVLWRKVTTQMSASTAELIGLINGADYADAGEASFQNVFGLGVGDLVEDFLGEGNWSPNPSTWNIYDQNETPSS